MKREFGIFPLRQGLSSQESSPTTSKVSERMVIHGPLWARIRSATKSWITAQLQLYGIPLQRKDSMLQLKALLETSVKNGQCESPSQAMIALERSLSKQYRQAGLVHEENIRRLRAVEFSQLKSPSCEAHSDTYMFLAKYFLTGPHGQPDRERQKEALILDACPEMNFLSAVQKVPGLAFYTKQQVIIVGWEDTISRGIDAAFARLSAPGTKSHVASSEMRFDLDRFMAKYFLDGIKGRPDPKKTPNPVELHSFSQEWPDLAKIVASVPGLHIAHTTAKSLSENTIIGWDADKVALCKKRRDKVQAEEEAKIEAERAAEEEDARQEALAPHRLYLSNHSPSPGPLKPEDLTGSYIIECEAAEEYIMDGEKMTLDIQKPESVHGVVAAFSLGLIEGTMLLALSHDALHALREEQPPMEDDSEDEWGDYDSDTGKRKASNPAEGRVVKRRLGETPQPNRVYIQWTGREISGPIAVDEKNEHTGYVDFEPSKATAQGQWAYPDFFGDEKLQFTIYKRSDEPDEAPKD
ncbi:uncharacterized protein ACLA_047510 [Aspergillus clavatus NRRL 1]|uniref:Uncharacterized protein n=1 Tax=Aspergillus clavatus (strain ATCC 1007 / CBS 513.65 / DSM 816 / NCTC 3887 / NRRL 1 / QM 1276 / 107) TaxID=344612 RepID=A1CHC7_ASPCL|nr:uncharacterized protein ACLA_047510 [Aspergillus clavatus NRRL 1]EAW10282.1 hypothetical protein ACLA_047510 [Aspergillus clavatus NRRL 1]